MTNKKSGARNRDIEELEKSFQSLAGSHKARNGKYASKGISLKQILPLALCLLLIVAVGIGIFAYLRLQSTQTITTNITVVGVDVNGMTRAEAEEAVDAAFKNLYNKESVTVRVEDQTVEIPASASMVSLDVKGAVDAAMKYSRFHADKKALDVSAYITVNKSAVRSLLKTLGDHFSSKLTQTTYSFTGTKPTTVTEIDEAAAVSLVITKGTPGIRLDLDLLYLEVIAAYSNAQTEVTYECSRTEPDELDWAYISSTNGINPVEAVMDPETFEVSGGTYGFIFDPVKAEEAVNNAQYGETVTIAYEWVKPQNTAEELKAALFKDKLATYTTKAGSDYNRNINLKLAAEACNGIVLYPGDVFSFNKTLGERTTAKGYKPATSYIAGESVPDIGGGICQGATTIYYCAVVSDLEIVERYPHGYASSYTPHSTDATVFWPSVDFKFRNNTDYPIRIEASTNKGHVTVSLIGTDTKDYYVKFEYRVTEYIEYEEVIQEMPADNEKGFKDGDVITTPYYGYKSESYRAKYDKETGKLIERKLENKDTYNKRDKVVCKIVDETTTGPSEGTDPTEPPVTDPDITVPPVSDPTPTEPPLTQPPVTEAPSTEAPSTEAPATEPPATSPPATTLPVTEAPPPPDPETGGDVTE